MTEREIENLVSTSSIADDQATALSQTGSYRQETPQTLAVGVTRSTTVYDGPLGKGYVVNVWDGEKFSAINNGPESWQGLPWVRL